MSRQVCRAFGVSMLTVTSLKMMLCLPLFHSFIHHIIHSSPELTLASSTVWDRNVDGGYPVGCLLLGFCGPLHWFKDVSRVCQEYLLPTVTEFY